jgi:tellurite resistance protein TehA-like permease
VRTVLTRFFAPIEYLNTGYFALVMATGIVSIAYSLRGFSTISEILFVIDIAAYIALVILYILRIFVFPQKVWGDLTNAGKVFGYLTFVAGTDVLGTRFALSGVYGVSVWLGLIALVSWAVLMYFVLVFLLFYNHRPIEEVINGSWLIATVSAESLSTIATALVPHLPAYREVLLFVACSFWGLGIVLYFIFITLILYRFFFYPITSRALSPPYWINMGAMAITTLAGSRLVLYPFGTKFLVFIQPFVEGLTIVGWVWGTWWIPFLILMGIWKYFVLREPLSTDPALWSMVFPVGMYTVCCTTMSEIPGLHIVHRLVTPGLVASAIAWTSIAITLFIRISGGFRRMNE